MSILERFRAFFLLGWRTVMCCTWDFYISWNLRFSGLEKKHITQLSTLYFRYQLPHVCFSKSYKCNVIFLPRVHKKQHHHLRIFFFFLRRLLSRVKQIISPDWMHETSAWVWCTGKTQRNRVRGRWEGGSGWGIHVNPWLIHVNVWQKPLQYCKVISLQLIKINGKK